MGLWISIQPEYSLSSSANVELSFAINSEMTRWVADWTTRTMAVAVAVSYSL